VSWLGLILFGAGMFAGGMVFGLILLSWRELKHFYRC
jgi:hypothetical protein